MSGPSVELPPAVGLAQKLAFALVALVVLRAVVTVVFEEQLVDSWADAQRSSMPREFLEGGAPEFLMIAAIIAIVLGGLLAIAAYEFGSGLRWAQVVALAMAALTVAGGLLALAQDVPFWYVLFGVFTALVAVGLILVLLGAEARAWFGSDALR